MAKAFLPVYPYLTDLDEDHEDHVLKGTLRCHCGGTTFRIYHNGEQAHPLLGSWFSNWIKPGSGTLLIDAHCSVCGQNIPLHCSARTEDAWNAPSSEMMTAFVHPKLHDQRVRLEVAYGWEDESADDEWSTAYTDFNLDAWNDEHPQKIRIFE